MSPRERTLEDRSKFWIGMIAVGVVVAIIAAMLMFRQIGVGYTRYQAEFAQAAQLKKGDYVSVAGVDIGEVKSVVLDGTKVLVDMRVRDEVKLGSETQAAIKTTTLLGSRYVELRPRGAGAIPNKRIMLSHTEVPYDLQALLADTAATYEQVDTAKLAQSIEILAKQLNGLPEALPDAMKNLKELSGIVATRRTQIGELLKSASTVTSTLHRQQANLGHLVYQGRDLLGEFVSRKASFQRLMVSITKVVDLLSKVVVKDRPAFETLLRQLKDVTAMASDHDDYIRNLLQILPVPLRNLTNATGSAYSLNINLINGLVVDNWMCAISSRAEQWGMLEYFKDCE
ncbi:MULTISPECIES: MCE family protein [unclassified Mycobacteroides]|uniref:MCE family protein n=1 Tax=unclassified Mycobacteroides TaxID=2618759 RepID=UPI001323B570|nr:MULTISPECIES: MCE family protein [unclassified Mycobacteroides]MUM19186.1 mammalian cell entry protein [Mycobacteroides sp. CBMA 326]